MKDIIEFFTGLFDSNRWPARWHCGYWSDFHGWLYIVSDLMIWVAYFLIPVIIIDYTSRKRTGLKFHNVYILFASFILLCGTTHFVDAVMFWLPIYRVNAIIRFVTGVVSLLTVIYLIKILPAVFKQRTNVELENEIAKREEAERKLAEANRDLQSFAYIASHDLQEPLRKIRVFSSLLNAHVVDSVDIKSKEYATKINNSTERMQHLIQDVLNLSTIKEDPALAEVNVEDAVNIAKEDLEIKILEKNAVVNCSLIPPVKANKHYLSQLFLNLISNALKFCNKEPEINISGEKKGDTVVIYVTDNGIGMKQEDTAKIFQAFKRLHSKTEYEGTGIGLTICKKIVEIHNGKLDVISRPDQGTTFIIELPAA